MKTQEELEDSQKQTTPPNSFFGGYFFLFPIPPNKKFGEVFVY